MFSSTNLRVAEYQPRSVMAPHDHDEPSFAVLLAGDFSERVGRSERHYASNFVTFGPAGVIHSQRFGGSGARQIIIRPDAAWLAYLVESKVKLTDSPFAHAPVFGVLGHRLQAELDHGDEFSAIACEGLTLELIAAFARTSADRATQPPAWLRQARDLIHERARDPLTIKQVALAVDRHEVHVAREFRRFFGVSIGSYLRQVRTEHAARLLRQPGSSITDIALECGFASHSHLCRVFRAQFGVSPSQYRARG